MSHSPSSPAFVVGITGYMDIPECDQKAVRERLRTVFRWLRDDPNNPSDDAAVHQSWWPQLASGESGNKSIPLPGLGLAGQRIVLLTSLAPGADTLAAQIAQEEGIEVRAPLPFPAPLYRESSSFHGTGVVADAQELFNTLITNTSQRIDTSQPIDTFPVLLASDLDLDPTRRMEQFQSDLSDRDRRHLRYRAAGEFVASYSHLMIALYDATDDQAADLEAGAGTATIVDVLRRGPTAGILPVSNHFPWTDSGPALHLPTRSNKRMEAHKPAVNNDWLSTRARFLPPYPPKCDRTSRRTAPDATTIAASYSELRDNTRLLSDYEAEAATTPRREPETDLHSLLNVPALTAAGLTEKGKNFLESLMPIAQARSAGATIARACDNGRQTMMRSMALCAFLAALSFHGFSHWHFAYEASHPTLDLKNVEQGFGIAFLIVSLSLLLCIILRYRHYKRSNKEWLRFDARAIAEGLRVQFYWAAAGISASVAACYMHRQKGQLNWIRNAISSLSFPYEHRQEKFDALIDNDRKLILTEVVKAWPQAQHHFFKKAVPKAETLLHRFHILGWALTLGSLIQVALIFCWKASTLFGLNPLPHLTEPLKLGAIAATAFAAALIWAVVSRPKSHAPKPAPRLLDRLLSIGRPPVTLTVVGIISALVATVPHLAFWAPKSDSLWIILIGAALVGGAIMIAWGEKLSLAEHARQYESMGHLFENACARANELLDQWKPNGATGAIDAESELQGLLADLGKEALDENAAWLLLHRSRPLEPFLAG